MSDESIIIDNLGKIEAFALLQVYYKLKLEVENPNGPKWAYSPAQQANAIMDRLAVKRKRSRIKKTVFDQYRTLLIEKGVLR